MSVDPAAYAFPHPEPRTYDRTLRTWTYAWWKPLAGILLTLVGFFVVAAIVLAAVVAIWVAFEPGSYGSDFRRSIDVQANVTPAGLLGTNLGLASMILVTWFILRVVHRMRPRWLMSVVPKMRWRFFAVCLGLAVLALVAQVLVGALLPAGVGGDEVSGSVNSFTTTTALSALVVLLTTPLQAAGEEYLFRGYLLMAFGSFFAFGWVPAWASRWLAIVVTATLFALAHGAQNFPLFFDRLAFGLIAAWLVIRTGGLEAGIALHILNNLVAFGFALAFGDLTSSLNASSSSWWQIVLTVTQSTVYVVPVLLVARRMGLQNRTRPPLPAASVPPGSAPVPTG